MKHANKISGGGGIGVRGGGAGGAEMGNCPPKIRAISLKIRAIFVWSESGGSIYMKNQLKNGPPLLDQNSGKFRNSGKSHLLPPQTESVPYAPEYR